MEALGIYLPSGHWTNRPGVYPSGDNGILPMSLPISPTPTNPFSIVVVPDNSRIVFGDDGNQVGALVLTVRIIRVSGYADPIDVTSACFVAPNSGSAKVNGHSFASLSDITEADVPDQFTIELTGLVKSDWDAISSLWVAQFLTGASEYTSGNIAQSNNFTVIDPPSGTGYLTIDVTPTFQSLPYTNPPVPVSFVATISRHNGYTGNVTAKLPNVQSEYSPNGDGSANAIVSMDGVEAPDVGGYSGHWAPRSSIIEKNAPDTVTVIVTVGTNWRGTSDTGIGSMHLEVTGADNVTYISNIFSAAIAT